MFWSRVFFFIFLLLSFVQGSDGFAFMRALPRAGFISKIGGASRVHYSVGASQSQNGCSPVWARHTSSQYGVLSGLGRLSSREKGTLRQYTVDSYMGINQMLREGGLGLDKGAVRIIDRALAKLPVETGSTLYRYESRSAEDFPLFREGAIVQYLSYISTSRLALGGGNVHITFVNHKSGRDISPYSHYPEEQEVLFPRGTSFRVLESNWRARHLEVTLEEIHSSSSPQLDTLGTYSNPYLAEGDESDDDLALLERCVAMRN